MPKKTSKKKKKQPRRAPKHAVLQLPGRLAVVAPEALAAAKAMPDATARKPCLVDCPYTIEQGVTQSLLSSFVDCRQRCRHHLDGWRRTETKDSLEYGSLFHFLLETLYGSVRDGAVSTAADAAVGTAWWRGVLGAWRAKSPSTADAAATQQTEFCIAQATGVWDGYLKAYKEDFDAKRWIELEGVFDAVFHDVRLRGRRDGMLRFKRSLWLLETKTKSQIAHEAIEGALAYDFQNLFYVTGNEVECDEHVGGVKYNIVRRPSHKLKQAESLPDYTARIAADVAKRPEHWFVRYEVAYPRDVLRAHQDQLRWKLDEFRAWLGGDMKTYRNEAACQKRWNCGYIALCAGDETPYRRDGRIFEELED